MKLIKLWLPVAVWCWLIFFLSSIPGLQTPFGVIDTVIRKFAHMTEYFILTLLLYRAVRQSFSVPPGALIFCQSLLSFLYAVSDEYHQTFIMNRSGNIVDVSIDALGIFAAVFVFIKYGKRGNAGLKTGMTAGGAGA